MKLWLLRPREDQASNPWEPWYGKSFGFVVRADTEAQARELAQANGGDETRNAAPWRDSGLATCEELAADGAAEVIISDFHSA